MRTSATLVVVRLADEVHRLQAKERADIANCVATKTSMPEHYWQPRHKAEERLRSARRLLEAIMEEENAMAVE